MTPKPEFRVALSIPVRHARCTSPRAAPANVRVSDAGRSGLGRRDRRTLPSRSRRYPRGATRGDGARKSENCERKERGRHPDHDGFGVRDTSGSGRHDAAEQTEHDQTNCGSQDQNPPDPLVANAMPSCREREVRGQRLEIPPLVIVLVDRHTSRSSNPYLVTLTVSPPFGGDARQPRSR